MNVGVAMATPHGLVVPNIKRVEVRSALRAPALLLLLASGVALRQGDALLLVDRGRRGYPPAHTGVGPGAHSRIHSHALSRLRPRASDSQHAMPP